MLFGKKKTTPRSTKKTTDYKDYVEVTVPKLAFKDSTVSTFWLLILVVFSFLLGMTYTKLTYLQSGTTISTNTIPDSQGQPAGEALTVTRDDIDSWAQSIGINMGEFKKCMDSDKYADNIDKDIQDALAAQAEATPTFYINGERVVGALPYESFKTVIDKKIQESTVGNNILPNLVKTANAQTDTTAPTEAPVTADVAQGHLPALGNPNAPVKIVEFSDFQCPYCKRYFDTTQQQIVDDYVKTGKAVIYYRHLPLEFHPMARTFAMASECANEQSKFWEMHDKIFSSQN